MKIIYVSSSSVFSRSANSIHVINMCNALSYLQHKVTLFALSEKKLNLQKFYGNNFKNFSIIAPKINIKRGKELFIFILSLKLLFSQFPDIIICRNIYSAFFFGVLLKKKVIYETHAPEYGIRKILQNKLLQNNHKVIVISNALKKILIEHHHISQVNNIHVLHDASNIYFQSNKKNQKHIDRSLIFEKYQFKKNSKLVGYFGHLYAGRGIEIIKKIAIENPNINFLIFGGNEAEIKHYKKHNLQNNLFYMGFVNPAKVKIYMSVMDVLLMPYQEKVSIGLQGIDTSKWMSPMKLFEYMSVKVPIVSSNLPVLKEILISNKNSILVKPDNTKQWSKAIEKILNNQSFANKIATNSYKKFQDDHTWIKRAHNMLL